MLTDAQLDELCARSANGEGVRVVLAEFGIEENVGLLWLRDNHHARLKEAKKAFAADPVKVSARIQSHKAEVAVAEAEFAAAEAASEEAKIAVL